MMRHSSGEFKLVVEQYAIAAPLLGLPSRSVKEVYTEVRDAMGHEKYLSWDELHDPNAMPHKLLYSRHQAIDERAPSKATKATFPALSTMVSSTGQAEAGRHARGSPSGKAGSRLRARHNWRGQALGGGSRGTAPRLPQSRTAMRGRSRASGQCRKCGFIKENKKQCQRKKQTVDGVLTKFCWTHNAVDALEDDPIKQIELLKKEIEEHEAVEAYMMDVVKGGGGIDDLLRAHYRDGEVVDGKWVERE